MNNYLVFISYRHTGRDSAVAGALRHGIESFHAGKRSALPRIRKVFRDTDELPTSSDLGADIENALQGSSWLIALCSEDYVQSRWCRSEIRSYIALGRKDRILPVLVSGSPETAIPEEIRDLAPAADLRNSKNLKEAAKDCVPLLLGRMCGENPDELLSSHRRFRLAQLACGAAALAAAILGFALYATRTADVIADNNRKIEEATGEARTAREEAVRERNNALLNQAEFTAVTCQDFLSDGEIEEAIRTALSGLPEDLHGEYPVSSDLLGVLHTALYIREPAFKPVSSTPLSFRVTDSDRLSARSAYLTLSGEDITALNLNDGTVSSPGADLGEHLSEMVNKGLELGYHHVIGVNRGSAGYAVFYDPGKPIRTGNEPYTVNGEPFEADHAVHSDNSESKAIVLAWRGGETPAAAVLLADQTEAAALLQNEGEVVSAAAISEKRVAAADSTGTLAVYSAEDGSVLFPAETDCRYVQYYYYGAPRLYCVTTDGRLCCVNAENGAAIWTADLPSPAVTVDCSRRGSNILVLCEDGVRLCSLNDGSVKEMIPGTEGAILAQWDSESSGTRFALVFEDRADLYEISWREDEDKSVSMVLSHPDMSYGNYLCYSADGKYLYLELGGDIAKWDASSGELLWVNRSNWGEITADLTDTRMNVAGDAFWRQMYSGRGLEKIDADSGETLYSVENMAGSYFPMPEESPDRKTGLIVTNRYSHELVVFDTETGRKLWQKDLYETERPAAYSASFTEDSEQVWLKLTVKNPDGFTSTWILRRYAAKDGTLLREDRFSNTDDPLNEMFNALPSGFPQKTKQQYTFCGEAVRTADSCILRDADGAVLLNGKTILEKSRLTGSGTELAIAPDSSSICLSGSVPYPPLLIHPAETDTLVEKAKRRVGGDAQ